MKFHLIRIAKKVYYVIAAAIIAAALLVTAGRMLTPYLNDHIPDMDALASHLLNAPVSIEKVYISWHIYEPELSFEHVNFLNVGENKPEFQINKIAINFNIFASLLTRQWVVENIRVIGVHLNIYQTQQGAWSVQGFSGIQITDKLTGSSVKSDTLMSWILSLPRLVLRDINLTFYPLKKTPLSFTLNRFILNNSGNTHALSGQGILNQDIPTKIETQVRWTGNVNDLSHVQADFYLYLEGVNLSQWLTDKAWHNFQLQQGLGSAKIWAQWKNNAWQKIQSDLQFYHLAIKSALSNKIIEIPRVAGNLGWRRDGDKQVFAGDQLFLDLPQHLWPMTSFTFILQPDATGNLFFNSLKIKYFDSADVKKIVLASGLLSSDQQQQITSLNPSGQIQDFNVSLSKPSWSLENVIFSSTIVGLNIDAFKKLPGITNMSGSVSWDGQDGQLILDSSQTIFNLDSVFANPLQFDKLTGSIYVNHNTQDTWTLSAKNIFLQNLDAQANSAFKLIIPAKEAAQIDLTANFKMNTIEHISDYLPLKHFPPPLQNWLRNAFKGGQVTSGSAILQGKVTDFPFDHQNGTFIIKSLVHNADFHFAPDWPDIHKLNGNLVFSGRSMAADVDSGEITKIPFTAIRAVIPYMGDQQPSILNVQGNIQSTLENLLRFVHSSPLEETIGNNFEEMQLSGPMQLKLNLIIPLGSPKTTKVAGDIVIPNATLDLTQWKIKLEQLQGNIHFTETDIVAKNLKGKLFGEDTIFTIESQHPAKQPSYVKATLQGSLDLLELQKWLGYSFEKFISGKTNYVAALNFHSQNNSPSIDTNISTDLKGVTINLPDPYDKKPEDLRDLQINITTRNRQIRAQFDYNKLVSAILSLQQTNTGLQFSSVELKAGAFNLYNQQLNHLQALFTKENDAWEVNIKSDEVMGQVTVPTRDKQPISGKFQRFYIKSVSKTQASMDPKSLPPLSMEANDVRYDEKQIGYVNFNLIPIATGLSIRNFSIQSPVINLHARGEWISASKNKTVSHLIGNMSTERLSDFLQAWGYGTKNLVATKANVDFNLTWPDAPYNLAPQGMSGNFSLSIGLGRIVNLSDTSNAKVDLARLLNVFSLTSIPHFGELFQKGYVFDYVKGDFSLKNGNAFTENTKINGTVAHVVISGRIGLANKDFDLVLSVTPYVTESLPLVAAAVTSWNPITGIAAWLVNKMLVSRMVSQAVTHNYTVKGPWSNPTWTSAETSSSR